MALVIRSHHRAAFAGLLDGMFRLRRRVFVDRLRWRLPEGDGLREIDQFDAGGCVHLVALTPDGRVGATDRLTPSLEPNVSCDVLQGQFGVVFPRAPHMVEVSRYCVDPDLDEETRRTVLTDLRISQFEFCKKAGWTHTVGVLHDWMLERAVRSGMRIDVLGGPVKFAANEPFSYAIVASEDPARPVNAFELMGGPASCLQDPDDNPELIARFGDRRVA